MESRKINFEPEGMITTFDCINVMDVISDRANIERGYFAVVNNLTNPRLRYRMKKEEVITKVCDILQSELSDGSFRISPSDVRDITINSYGKIRCCQAPTIIKRIGCHIVTEAMELVVNPTLIINAASNVKGRGPHWLHNRIVEDMRTVPHLFNYFYKCDIRQYFDSIDQEILKMKIRNYVGDSRFLSMLDNFVDLLPSGISKGLRSSQCFSNIYLSDVHKLMVKECFGYFSEDEWRPLYYNYCDDTAFAAPDKKSLWRLRDIYVEECRRIGLDIKPDEAVRPITSGLDIVGYIHYPTHTRLRKRTKQKAARALARVKSRKRRQEIIGSFKGMAAHGDCKHLFNILTHRNIDMRKFSEMGVSYAPADGKKRFPGKVMRLASIQNKPIEIHDYESDIKTSQGDGRYLVSFRDIQSGEWAKFFTSSEEMKNILDQISDMEDGFPFETIIQSEIWDGNKVKYKFT
ncbi:MAG: hypothetical protein ACI4AK_09350 [Lepagella sp.]